MNLNQVVAGAPQSIEIVERRAPIEGDRDGEFKKALVKSHDNPQGVSVVSKAEADPKEIDLKRPEACTDLIKRAHTSGATWNPFAESQDLAKAATIAAGNGRVVRIFKEGGETRFEVEAA